MGRTPQAEKTAWINEHETVYHLCCKELTHRERLVEDDIALPILVSCAFLCVVLLSGRLSYAQFSSVQFSRSVVSDSVTPWIAACQASLSITNSRSLLKLMPIKSVMPSSHFILCRPLLLLPPIPPSITVFSNESTLRMRWPKYWSFSFNISPSNEHPGLISFRMDWLDLFAVQGTLESLLQHHSSKASIFSTQLFSQSNSHPYMTNGKTIALTRRTFFGKVMSLLFNMLSRRQAVPISCVILSTFWVRPFGIVFHGLYMGELVTLLRSRQHYVRIDHFWWKSPFQESNPNQVYPNHVS